jgi:NAD(P)-dependent dehydrogenase (short-subunit alcohol dehydrogenase family)
MVPAFSLRDRNILVTGASSGLGRACAVVASRLGANIILVGRDKERLDTVLRELATGGRHAAFTQDLTIYGELEHMVSSAVEQVGPVDGFVHSAGLGMTLPLRSTTPAQLEKVFAINVYAAIELCRLLAKKNVIGPNGSSFVLMSSIMGLVGEPGKIAYCASKSALLSATRAMAVELAPRRIRVNCVLPAVVETEMAAAYFASVSPEARAAVVAAHPLGLGTPDDVAGTCAFLLSDASRWITGSHLIVDGGYSAK